MRSKPCEHCGGACTKRPTESNYGWARRRFCGRPCATAVGNAARGEALRAGRCDVKPCEHCGVLFGNSRKQSAQGFADRRFCGKPCSNAATKTVHGHARGKRTPEYDAWSSMRGRCLRESHKAYAHYGGRGIGIDPAWDDFAEFMRDMGPRPSPRHSLDRIDNSRGYGPGNCRWATQAQQMQNTRVTKLTPVSVMCLRVLHGRGAQLSVLAGAFGVTEATADAAIRRRSWRSVP